MRVLQFTNCLGHAGAERVVQLLSNGLHDHGVDVGVVSLLPPMESALVEIMAAAGIPMFHLDVTKRTPWRVARLRRIIREFQPDVVHAHLFHSHMVARLATLSPRRRWVLVNTLHATTYGPNRDWYYGVDRATLALCDVQTAVSRAVAVFHAERLGVSADSLPVVYNGTRVPTRLSADRVRQLRAEWGVTDCEVVIGSVGRLSVAKGYDDLLRLAPRLDGLVPRGEKWALVIIGEGEERASLEELARGLDLERLRIVLPGFRSDADQAMGAFDLFVMPSRFEGFGMTLAEAMAHGLPVLTSPLEPLKELVAQYDQGACWAEDVTDSDLATLIAAWARKPRTRPLAVFSVEQMVDGYLRVYETAIRARRACARRGMADASTPS